jgi:hypothetical protein
MSRPKVSTSPECRAVTPAWTLLEEAEDDPQLP